MNPCDLYPFLRLARDADWRLAAQTLAAWLHHARMGYPCPPPDGWRWRSGSNDGEPAYLSVEWGRALPDVEPGGDITDDGAAVDRDEAGRWRWLVYRGGGFGFIHASGLDDNNPNYGPARDAYLARAATWADPRDAVADCERWLDANRPTWRGGVVYGGSNG